MLFAVFFLLCPCFGQLEPLISCNLLPSLPCNLCRACDELTALTQGPTFHEFAPIPCRSCHSYTYTLFLVTPPGGSVKYSLVSNAEHTKSATYAYTSRHSQLQPFLSSFMRPRGGVHDLKYVLVKTGTFCGMPFARVRAIRLSICLLRHYLPLLGLFPRCSHRYS